METIMNTATLTHRFAVPVFIAAAAHVVLLFGIRPTIAPLTDRVFIDPLTVLPPMPVDLTPPPKVDPDPSADPVKPLDRPGPIKPVTEDRSTDLRPVVVPDPVAPPAVKPTAPLDKIPEGGWGDGTPGKPQPFENGNTDVILSRYLDNPPRAKMQVAPVYPASLRQAGIEGTAMVEFEVDSSGKVTSARAVQSTHREFEDAAVRAVLKWSFEPGRYHGKAVRFRMAVPIGFTITGE